MKRKILALFVVLLFSNSLFAQSQPKFDTLSVGKIKQVISYTGNTALPIMLFLHGGPGSSRMKQAPMFSNVLENHFLVIQWDQRNAGRTLALNQSNVPITLKLMENDTHELIEFLLKKFNRKKLYLVGESWGTVLGFKMAEKYPELLNAYLAFSPVVDQTRSEKLLVEKLKIDAEQKGNISARNELSKVQVPFSDYQQLFYSRKWMLRHDGVAIADKDTTALKAYIQDWSKTWLPTWNDAIGQNLFVQLPKINCPVYFFLGAKDLQTNFDIAKDYFKFLKAPKKELFQFENAGHSVLTEEAKQVQKIMVEQVLNQTDQR